MAKPTYKGYLLCRRKNETFTLKCTLHAARERWVAWQMTSHICQSCKRSVCEMTFMAINRFI